MAEAGAVPTIKNLPGMLERLKVKIEPTVIDGVRAYRHARNHRAGKPQPAAHSYAWRLLCARSGRGGLPEAIFMAGFGHIKVISVDYRMPPEAVFPAALDDGITVWKAALKTTAARTWRSSVPRRAAR